PAGLGKARTFCESSVARPGVAWQGWAGEGGGRQGKGFGIGESTKTGLMHPEIGAFRIVGVSPVPQNNPANLLGKTEGQSLAGKKLYKDDEEAQLRLYKSAEGNYWHPAEAFIKAMVKAVSRLKFGKVSAPAAIRGAVFMAEPLCIIEDAKGRAATKYTID